MAAYGDSHFPTSHDKTLDISKDGSEAMSTFTPYSLSFLLTLFNRSFHEQSEECYTENNRRLEQH